MLLGPAVGGGLMLLLGPAWGLLTNVLLYLPFTIFLALTPHTGHVRTRDRAPAAPGWPRARLRSSAWRAPSAGS